MLTYLQAILLGFLQGVTELFPISSLGHSVLVPALLGWHIDQASDQFLAFVVATHFATALVLFGFFFREWIAIITGIARSFFKRKMAAADIPTLVGWRIVVSSIPAGLLGLLLKKKVEGLFASPVLVAVFLVANGIVLYVAERIRRKALEGKADDAKIAALSWRAAFGIGCAQAFALIPGFSRTGVAMTGSLLSGLSHENAARYAFLLATPLISAAALLEAPRLFANGGAELPIAFVGALAAALASYLSVRFLTRYFETKTLEPFAGYCFVAGLVALAVLL
ncbi:MAG: undecaprenyl-diphosphate phosphatase [Alphaproteobacteria bacterium]|nr:undecaprenyl-diphosphate phosphatase [Alphaproteobacteria bacterium]